jgi:predicted lipid-binding transport protein (Tim44 family)
MKKLWSMVLVAMLVVVHGTADAKRMGGGGSVGKQSSNVTQREAARAPAQNTPPQNAATQNAAQASPFAFQGAAPAGAGNVDSAPVARQYNPEKVGNDASARPWEQNHQPAALSSGSGSGVQIGSALAGSQNWGVPEGFDTEGFLTAAKRNFVTLQSAWDRSDIASLRAMMTDEMLSEIRSQLSEREAQRPGQPNQTDVVMIDAQLLGIEDLGNDYMASVEFSGMIREDASAGPTPFREVWNMTKPKSGSSGWLVAGVQALQ